MKIAGKSVTTFKIKNRSGFAAICNGHLTEGSSVAQAVVRMTKALRRTTRKGK